MRYQAEKIPPKKHKPIFLFMKRFCENCNLAFWLEKVPAKENDIDRFPSCPDCGRSLYRGLTNGMRIKRS